jgi:hypothetical protein
MTSEPGTPEREPEVAGDAVEATLPPGFTDEVIAAHEAGHATVFLACGIPVAWVEIYVRQFENATRLGFTETAEDAWMLSSPLATESKLLRRLIGKAGGMAGEAAAGVLDVQRTLSGSASDVGQIGDALIQLNLLSKGAKSTPASFLLVALQQAGLLIEKNRSFFDELRERLLHQRRVEGPFSVAEDWQPADDTACMQILVDTASQADLPQMAELVSGA